MDTKVSQPKTATQKCHAMHHRVKFCNQIVRQACLRRYKYIDEAKQLKQGNVQEMTLRDYDTQNGQKFQIKYNKYI